MPSGVDIEGKGNKSDAQIFGEFLTECMRLGGMSVRQVESQIDKIISYSTIQRRTRANSSFPDEEEMDAYARWLGIRPEDLERRWRLGVKGAIRPVPSMSQIADLLQTLSDEEHKDHFLGAVTRLTDEAIARVMSIIALRLPSILSSLENQKSRLRSAYQPPRKE